MSVQLDHYILNVNDLGTSTDFYVRIMGFGDEGHLAPFTRIRVCDSFVLQLAQRGTKGGDHLAFSMSRAEFEDVFRRLRADGIAFGDRFDTVGSMKGPGEEVGAQGPGKSLYFFDPDKHLIEIRHHEV